MKFNKHPLFIQLIKLADQISMVLNKAHEQCVETTVLTEAHNYGVLGLPKDSDPSFEPYVTTIRGFYNGLKKEVSVRLNGGIQKMLGAVSLATVNQKISTIQITIKSKQEKIRHLEIDLGRIHTDFNNEAYRKYRLLLCPIGLGECFWNIAFFLKIGDYFSTAILVGAVVGIAQIVSVTVAFQLIKDIEIQRKKYIAVGITLIACILLSCILSPIRYWFVHIDGGADIPLYIMNPGTFACINMLFIIATASLVYRYFPSRSDEKKQSKIDAIRKEIERINLNVQKDEIVETSLLDEREMLIALHTRIADTENNLCAKIDAQYEYAIGKFKEENTSKRSDGIFPSSFRKPHNPLNDPENLIS